MAQTDYHAILEAIPIPSVLIGANQRLASANTGAVALFGEGLQSRHYISALRQPALVTCVETVLNGKRDLCETVYLATEAMRETRYRVSAARMEAEDGPMVLVSFVDATDLQEADQIRRDFVANVSHELRTPLTALLGFIETLRGAAKDDAAARDRFLEVMEKEANRMNRLVQDLLSLSRVESEQRMRPQDEADIAGIVQSSVSSLRPIANEAGASIDVEGIDAERKIQGDPDQLAQVFSNLIENAIKYGPRGTKIKVTLSETNQDRQLRGDVVHVSVEDNGDGFDPTHISRLTERFYRIDGHRSREMGGTGLGLAIVKHIVTRHRGRLQIDSTPGSGSCFTVVLPVS